MSKDDLSGSESQENDSDSCPEEQENGANEKITEYEKQRLKRMEENRARLEAMGLHTMACSLIGSVQNKKRSDLKGKKKVDKEDEDYKPPQVNEGISSSSEEEDHSHGTRSRKSKKKTSTPNGEVSIQKLSSNLDYVEDNDDALMQAIALSLQDSAGFLDAVSQGPSQSSEAPVINGYNTERKPTIRMQEDARKTKRKKSFTSRVQMTEDELILHFFQFDEAGKGGITVRDLCRVAAAHDFTWSDKEIEDMIYLFDSDGYGKLSLDDFSKIVDRCNMRQGSENAAMGSR